MRKIITVFAGTLVLALGVGASVVLANPPGGPHTPVTICHKPGTPAEQTLVVDDDAVPGHLGHGDYLGPCNPTTTTTDTTTTTETTTESTTTETTTEQTTTEKTTTEETNTTPSGPPCPNGEEPIHGKDGTAGNDACNPCDPPVNLEKCPGPSDSTTIETTTESTPTIPTTPTETTPITTPPVVKVVPPAVVTKKKLEKELKKQEKKNGVAEATATAKPQNPNELPYTGLPLWAVVMFGGSLVGSGLYLRRQ